MTGYRATDYYFVFHIQIGTPTDSFPWQHDPDGSISSEPKEFRHGFEPILIQDVSVI